METRQKELAEIKSYIEGVDKEVTMILQSLQWDRKHLIEGSQKVSCSYDVSHRVPPDKREEHERKCGLRSQGYSLEEEFLPEPLDPDADTLVKFNKENITTIIENASKQDPMFRKGAGCPGPEPLTLGRLQATYTADERRAIHDAAVTAAPACHDLTDLALISSTDGDKSSKPKSRMEVLAELRDMRRRRAKYRVSGTANTKNYSHVLRDVIRTQMELYSATHATDTTLSHTQNNINQDKTHTLKHAPHNSDENKERFIDKERYADVDSSNKAHRKRHVEFTETDQSRKHKRSHRNRYDKHDDRHEKYYSTDDKYDRDYDRHSMKDKEKHSHSKDRSRDKYENMIAIKEEFGEEDVHRDNNERKRDKYSRSHRSDYYEEGSSSNSSKSKRRHRYESYEYKGRGDNRPKDDREKKRKHSSEKYSESPYKRYYDTVDIKQEIDSS